MMYFQDTNLVHLSNSLHLDNNCLAKIKTNFSEKDWVISFSGGADSVLTLYFLIALHLSFVAQRKSCDTWHDSGVRQRKLHLYFLNHYAKTLDNKRADLFNTIFKELKEVKNLKLQLHLEMRNIPKIAKQLKRSFENTASLMRKRQLKRINTEKTMPIFYGHSLSDWYETLFIRLNRGTSPPAVKPFTVLENDIEIRPLAFLNREEIRDLCNKLNLPYWDDPENYNTDIQRNYIRKSYKIINTSGLRQSAKNFALYFNKIETSKYLLIMTKDKLLIKSQREYWLALDFFDQQSNEDKHNLKLYFLRRLGLWPIGKNLRQQLSSNNFSYKPFAIEIENWNDNHYIVFRRGRKNLAKQTISTTAQKIIFANEITKAHFIKRPYGNKSVKKILSERKLSQRQRAVLPLECGQNKNEIICIHFSVFNMKNLEAFSTTL